MLEDEEGAVDRLTGARADRNEHRRDDPDSEDRETAEREAEQLEDGSLDPDELSVEPSWWDEGSDDET